MKCQRVLQSYGQSPSGGLVDTGKQSDRWHNRRWPKRKSLFRLGSSLRARRHRVRLNNDREWYHVMTSSAYGCHIEQVLQRRHVLKRSSTVGRCALKQLPPLHMWQKSSPVMPPSGVQADNYWRNQRVFQEDLVERCVHNAF